MKSNENPQLVKSWGSGNDSGNAISNLNYTRKRKFIHRRDGHVIGYMEGKTFFKNVKASRHMLRKPPGWALDVDIFERLKLMDIRYIEIRDRETKTLYGSTLELFERKAIAIDRGHGEQLALPLKFWRVLKADDTDLEHRFEPEYHWYEGGYR